MTTIASEFSQRDGRTHFACGVALAIFGTFLFALKSVIIKLAFGTGAGPMLVLTLRMLLALPFYVGVLTLARWDEVSQPITLPLIARTFVIGFFGYYLASYLDMCGLVFISAQLERLTLFTYPAFIAILAWMFLGESLSFRVFAAIGLCYGSILMMYASEISVAGGSNTRHGVWLVMAAALSYALHVVLAKGTIKQLGSQRFTCLAMIGSTACVCIHFLCTESVYVLWDAGPNMYLCAVCLAFFCTVIPSFMINEAISRIGATRTSVIGTAGPVLTIPLAIVLLGERSSWQHFVGMAMAIVGVSLVTRK